MASKLFSNDLLAVFESSDGAVYVAELQPFVTTDDANEMAEQIRNALLAISPQAMVLARAYSAIRNYTSTEMREGCAKIRKAGEQMTKTLTSGITYDIQTLTFVGWSAGDGSSTDGYSCWDFFDSSGKYLGADDCGIEPIFVDQH